MKTTLGALACAAGLLMAAGASAAAKPTVVLVHGAFADASRMSVDTPRPRTFRSECTSSTVASPCASFPSVTLRTS